MSLKIIAASWSCGSAWDQLCLVTISCSHFAGICSVHSVAIRWVQTAWAEVYQQIIRNKFFNYKNSLAAYISPEMKGNEFWSLAKTGAYLFYSTPKINSRLTSRDTKYVQCNRWRRLRNKRVVLRRICHSSLHRTDLFMLPFGLRVWLK